MAPLIPLNPLVSFEKKKIRMPYLICLGYFHSRRDYPKGLGESTSRRERDCDIRVPSEEPPEVPGQVVQGRRGNHTRWRQVHIAYTGHPRF